MKLILKLGKNNKPRNFLIKKNSMSSPLRAKMLHVFPKVILQLHLLIHTIAALFIIFFCLVPQTLSQIELNSSEVDNKAKDYFDSNIKMKNTALSQFYCCCLIWSLPLKQQRELLPSWKKEFSCHWQSMYIHIHCQIWFFRLLLHLQ